MSGFDKITNSLPAEGRSHVEDVPESSWAEDRDIIERVLPYIGILKGPSLPNEPETIIRAFHAAARMFGDLSGKRILDYGCGSGSSTKNITELGTDVEVIGVDRSFTRVSALRAIISLPDTPFLLLEDGRIPLENESVDGVFSSFVHYGADPERMIPSHCEVARVLPKGAPYLIISGHPDRRKTSWTLEDFEKTLTPAGFELVASESVSRVTKEGEKNSEMVVKAVKV